MKKLTIMLTCLLATAMATSAQNHKTNHKYYRSGLYVGAKVGANLSTMVGQYALQTSRDNASKVGINAGIYGGYDILPWLGVGLEAIYARQGAMTQIENVKFRELHQYINVPLLVRFMPINNLELFTGAQLGILLDATFNYEIDAIAQTENITNLCNTSEVSIPIGIAYTFIDRLKLDLRYTIGLTDIYKSVESKAVNSIFSVTLGYTIPL